MWTSLQSPVPSWPTVWEVTGFLFKSFLTRFFLRHLFPNLFRLASKLNNVWSHPSPCFGDLLMIDNQDFKMTEREFVEKGDYGQRRKPWRSREDGVAPGRIYCWLSLRKTTEDQYYWFSNDRRIICFFGLFRFILLTYNSCLTLMWNRWSSRKIQTVQISWENLNWQHHDRQGVVLQYKSHGKIWPGGTLGQVGRIVLPNDGWERTQCRWWET